MVNDVATLRQEAVDHLRMNLHPPIHSEDVSRIIRDIPRKKGSAHAVFGSTLSS